MKARPRIFFFLLVSVFVVCLAILYLKVRRGSPKFDSDGFQVTIPRNESYDRNVGRIRSELVEDDALEGMFGAGVVVLQHYQEAFDDPAFLWSGFFAGKYAVKYSRTLRRSSLGILEAGEFQGDGVVVEVERIFRDDNGRVRILYGKQRQFSVNDLDSYQGDPAGFLTRLGFDFEEGSIDLEDFGLEASGL